MKKLTLALTIIVFSGAAFGADPISQKMSATDAIQDAAPMTNKSNGSFSHYRIELQVNKDGSFTRTIEHTFQLLKAENWTGEKIIIPYDPTRSQVKVLQASSTQGAQSINVPQEMIIDRPLTNGTDQLHSNEITVAFPEGKVGTIRHIKIEEKVSRPLKPNAFNFQFRLAEGVLFKDYEIVINSKLPLFVQLEDLEHFMTVKKSKTGSLHTIKITLEREFYFQESIASGATENRYVPKGYISSEKSP